MRGFEPSFIVLALPRSRTAWLAQFLTYGDWVCGHDELRHMRSFDDVRAWFSQPCIGTAETGAAPWWRMIERFAPAARIVVVRRPVAEVIESLVRVPGVKFDPTLLEATTKRLDRKLEQLERRMPNVLSVAFSELAKEETCARVFEHCLPYAHDPAHWARLDAINIQIDLAAQMRYFLAYRPALEKLATIGKHQTIATMHVRETAPPDGVTIQAETFDAWEEDGPPMVDEHLVVVGEAPGDWRKKNLPLMRSLYERGGMQIMTARCNGRMFGYLMTLITPSMASETLKSAVHTTFYASPLFPGLGMKLQRAALARLKGMGIDEVFMQTGTRGSGERLGAMYRRLGAANDGQMFRLDLKAT